jgi:hypothetical protein
MNLFKPILIFLGLFSSICVDSVFPVKRGRIKQVHRPRIPQPTGKQKLKMSANVIRSLCICILDLKGLFKGFLSLLFQDPALRYSKLFLGITKYCNMKLHLVKPNRL